MADKDVRLLDAGRSLGRDLNTQVTNRCHLAAAFAGHTNGYSAHIFGHRKCLYDIGAVAGGRDADNNIAGPRQGFYLAGEDLVKTIVITNSRENRCICREGDSRQTAPLFHKTTDEFRGQMLGISGTAAITHEEYLTALTQRGPAQVGKLINITYLRITYFFDQGKMINKERMNHWMNSSIVPVSIISCSFLLLEPI